MPRYNGAREKTGMYFDNVYDPKTEYYFVDYMSICDCSWIRIPYQTMDQVVQLVHKLGQQWGFDHEKKCMTRFIENLRITPERELAELHQVFNAETNQYEDDIINMRTYLFDWRYDIDEKWTGVKSLNKQEHETLEDWKVRVANAKADLKYARRTYMEDTSESIDRIMKHRAEAGGNIPL